MSIQVGLIPTMLIALVILFVGYFLNNKISFLKKNNIPEPVVVGIVFSILSMILFFQTGITFQFDMTLKNPMMLVFFTTVGLGASFKMLATKCAKLHERQTVRHKDRITVLSSAIKLCLFLAIDFFSRTFIKMSGTNHDYIAIYNVYHISRIPRKLFAFVIINTRTSSTNAHT